MRNVDLGELQSGNSLTLATRRARRQPDMQRDAILAQQLQSGRAGTHDAARQRPAVAVHQQLEHRRPGGVAQDRRERIGSRPADRCVVGRRLERDRVGLCRQAGTDRLAVGRLIGEIVVARVHPPDRDGQRMHFRACAAQRAGGRLDDLVTRRRVALHRRPGGEDDGIRGDLRPARVPA